MLSPPASGDGRIDDFAKSGRLPDEPVYLRLREDTFDMPDHAMRPFTGAERGNQEEGVRPGRNIRGFQFHIQVPGLAARSRAGLAGTDLKDTAADRAVMHPVRWDEASRSNSF